MHTNLHSKILTWSLVKLRGIVNPWFLSAVMNIIILWSTPTQIRYQRLNKVARSIQHSRTRHRNSLSCPGSQFNHLELHLQNVPTVLVFELKELRNNNPIKYPPLAAFRLQELWQLRKKLYQIALLYQKRQQICLGIDITLAKFHFETRYWIPK